MVDAFGNELLFTLIEPNACGGAQGPGARDAKAERTV
jgi:hypothetical protein